MIEKKRCSGKNVGVGIRLEGGEWWGEVGGGRIEGRGVIGAGQRPSVVEGREDWWCGKCDRAGSVF